MKRKIIFTAAVAAMMLGISVNASAQIIGEVLSTDIGVVIDGQPIQAYNIDGNMYVIAENLRSYGFDADWNESERTLMIKRNGELAKTSLTPDEINIKKEDVPINQKLYDVYSTDIKTYVADTEVEAKSIDGETMIKVRELTKYGTVDYDDTRRLATVEILIPCLEWDFENAQKEELVIDENTTYIGQVKDGAPYGVGKMISIYKDQKFEADRRSSIHYDWGNLQVYGMADLQTEQLCYFENGNPVGAVYTLQDLKQYTSISPILMRDCLFKNTRFEYYKDGEIIYGSDILDGREKTFDDEEKAKLTNNTLSRKDSRYIMDAKIVYNFQQNDKYVYGLRLYYFTVNGNQSEVFPFDYPVKFKALCKRSTMIDEDNNLYRIRGTQMALIRKNIKACSSSKSTKKSGINPPDDSHYYILSCDNKLYCTKELQDDSKDILVAENVKLFDEDSHNIYITDENNTLYRIDDEDSKTGEFRLQKVSDNVKDFLFLGDMGEYVKIGADENYTDVFYSTDENYTDVSYSTADEVALVTGKLSEKGELFIGDKLIDDNIIALGHDHSQYTCAYVKADGSLWRYSKRKLNSEENSKTLRMLADSGFKSVKVNFLSIFGLKEDGSLWGWFDKDENTDPIKLADNVKSFVCSRSEATVLLNNGDIITVTSEGKITEIKYPGKIMYND